MSQNQWPIDNDQIASPFVFGDNFRQHEETTAVQLAEQPRDYRKCLEKSLSWAIWTSIDRTFWSPGCRDSGRFTSRSGSAKDSFTTLQGCGLALSICYVQYFVQTGIIGPKSQISPVCCIKFMKNGCRLRHNICRNIQFCCSIFYLFVTCWKPTVH